jgi:peptide/nickel transport system substrate-binding protein
MWFNVGKGEPAKGPLGQDPRVRQALNLALDREALNQVVFNGEYVPGNQWVSPDKPYYQERFPIPKRDVAKATALLKEAGVKTPVPVDLMIGNSTEAKASAEVIQAMAAEAGFDMRIRTVEFATSLKEGEEGKFQAFLLNWSGRTDPDGNLYIFMRTGAPQNYGGYSNPEVDRLLDEARLRSDFAERKAIYEKVAEHLLRDNPYLYLYHRKVLIAHTDKVDGYKQMPDGLVRLHGVSIKK